MSDMKFQEDTNEFGAPPEVHTADFSSKLIGWGVVSTRDQAQYLMVGIGILILIAAFFVYRSI